MPIERIDELAEEYERGRLFFDSKDYIGAARILAEVVAAAPDNLGARLLLARAYYHSAQLGRAEAQLRLILERDPAEEYACLLLGRTLQRQHRAKDAEPYLRLHAAMTGA
ncbi:tetratricopeptide repeat protein [Nonomuraea roseoviolacea subsp. roseoviolacea]|uniref:Cytochrome c-type biogenesis protein CcmH/NrfG n=1 Tax=Nonomuraea roseoviolacea subsp. carminata TaxID=160689 RepID=A0ABT1K8J6_9ACTN|nr:tetratricopeptide repeat protein [Nonomuraea roseoviolacea]MCP2350339.1 cytochrome c-type biogenesis protein CcmH/NrfG [Nonomuraea roseoviolacea subsp. carminata]